MTIIDISRNLSATLAPWPGDTPFSLRHVLRRDNGETVNLSTLTLSAHFGTHVDAPHHFADAAAAVEELPLDVYWGPAQVVSVRRDSGPLVPADFAGYDLTLAPRVLVHSGASHLDPGRFPDAFVYPGPELAGFLAGQGIRLYGADAPSMDHADSKDLPGHHALLRSGIFILEGLDLSRAPDGLYELVALPLRILRGDGSPVRAALRPFIPAR